MGGGLVKVLMQLLTVRPTQMAMHFPIFSLSLLIQKEICRPLFQPSGDKRGFLLRITRPETRVSKSFYSYLFILISKLRVIQNQDNATNKIISGLTFWIQFSGHLMGAFQALLRVRWWCLVTQSCPTLCEPMDCSPPGSSVPGISQERILE